MAQIRDLYALHETAGHEFYARCTACASYRTRRLGFPGYAEAAVRAHLRAVHSEVLDPKDR